MLQYLVIELDSKHQVQQLNVYNNQTNIDPEASFNWN